MLIRLIVVAALIMLSCAIASAQNNPVARVPLLKSAVKIDGKIETAWKDAVRLELLANHGPGAGSKAALKSTVSLACDKNNLYVLFEFEDPSVTFAHVNPDDMLWDAGDRLDIAEIILQPEPGSLDYYELVMNPAGALLDAEVKWKRGQPTWNTCWPSKHPSAAAGILTGKGWCAEIQIPLRLINYKPGKDSYILANFHRADVDLSCRWLSWSPTLSNTIHVPSKFGKLILPNP